MTPLGESTSSIPSSLVVADCDVLSPSGGGPPWGAASVAAPPLETAPGRKRYATDEERKAARREAYRRNAEKQQALYYEICQRFNIPGQGSRWASHLAEIRHLQPMPPENVDLWRKLRYKPLHRWWLEHFPLAEIRAMGATIDHLSAAHFSQPDRYLREGHQMKKAAA